jgi:hypothetical protein
LTDKEIEWMRANDSPDMPKGIFSEKKKVKTTGLWDPNVK